MKKYIAFDIQWFTLFVILLIFSFITFEGATEVAVDPVIWYYNGAPVIYSFGVLMTGAVLLCLSRGDKIIIDGNFGLLFARIIICLIPLFYISDSSSFSSHYPVVIFTVLTYFFSEQVTGHCPALFVNPQSII